MVVNYQKILLPILKRSEVIKSFLLGVKHLLTSLEVSVCKCVVNVNGKGIALDLNRVDHVELSKCHWIVAIPGQGIAPWHAALTDSDVVTVGDAPVTVECVMLLRPIMNTALLSRGYIQEMDGDLGTNTHSCRNANDDGS
jgi:hypothetical protein